MCKYFLFNVKMNSSTLIEFKLVTFINLSTFMAHLIAGRNSFNDAGSIIINYSLCITADEGISIFSRPPMGQKIYSLGRVSASSSAPNMNCCIFIRSDFSSTRIFRVTKHALANSPKTLKIVLRCVVCKCVVANNLYLFLGSCCLL